MQIFNNHLKYYKNYQQLSKLNFDNKNYSFRERLIHIIKTFVVVNSEVRVDRVNNHFVYNEKYKGYAEDIVKIFVEKFPYYSPNTQESFDQTISKIKKYLDFAILYCCIPESDNEPDTYYPNDLKEKLTNLNYFGDVHHFRESVDKIDAVLTFLNLQFQNNQCCIFEAYRKYQQEYLSQTVAIQAKGFNVNVIKQDIDNNRELIITENIKELVNIMQNDIIPEISYEGIAQSYYIVAIENNRIGQTNIEDQVHQFERFVNQVRDRLSEVLGNEEDVNLNEVFSIIDHKNLVVAFTSSIGPVVPFKFAKSVSEMNGFRNTIALHLGPVKIITIGNNHRQIVGKNLHRVVEIINYKRKDSGFYVSTEVKKNIVECGTPYQGFNYEKEDLILPHDLLEEQRFSIYKVS